ncbi:urea transporter [Kovacikia minuta CCNUW1]|uniref:urea transporter n=1 Tax=Kovacikia minuta TaxID=2931930 RepID=UPI001CCA40ED|nr:urea transporter [Kovacikia minuta]UBF29295.1 urea transporter [Kovacikia minuta CCNUW1]
MAVEQNSPKTDEPLPLHELMASILAAEKPSSAQGLPITGTMQWLNDRLSPLSPFDIGNSILRGIGQVIFANNPLSGLVILIVIGLQSPWVALMTIVGVTASTLAAIALKLDSGSIRNGIFGFQGTLVGLALGTFGLAGNGAWNPVWAISVVLLAALTTVLMNTLGIWFARRFKVSLLGMPFHIVVLLFLGLILIIPQPYFDLGSAAPVSPPSESLDWTRLLSSLPIGFGQTFFTSQQLGGSLIFLAVALCTPIGAGVGLLGCLASTITGVVVGFPPKNIYAGFLGYNAIFTAIAIGGIFYAPNLRSIVIAVVSACFATLVLIGLTPIFGLLHLPVLAMPFCLVTVGCFLILRHSIPSLVPVALYTIASPEEHRLRYLTAKDVISNFRQQLHAAMQGIHHRFLFETADPSLKGDLRYLFDAIDRDQNGALSVPELTVHLRQAEPTLSDADLTYLFSSLDIDRSGAIEFEEFGELMLRHRRLMSKYNKFVTYFLPIDADQDDSISTEEMNVAMASVGEHPLTQAEVLWIQDRMKGEPLTWNRFIEMLLVT